MVSSPFSNHTLNHIFHFQIKELAAIAFHFLSLKILLFLIYLLYINCIHLKFTFESYLKRLLNLNFKFLPVKFFLLNFIQTLRLIQYYYEFDNYDYVFFLIALNLKLDLGHIQISKCMDLILKNQISPSNFRNQRWINFHSFFYLSAIN